MRKFIAVTVALLMVAAILSSGALAENDKGHKGGMGAGKGQNQSQSATGNEDKGNSHGQGHTLDKSKVDDTVIDTDDNGGEEEDASENIGDVEEDAGDNDNGDADEPAGHGKKNNKENKPDEKPQAEPNHGNAYGRVRNTQEVLDSIGLLAGEETAVQLNTLMTAYRDAKDVVAAKAALTALLDTLTQACTVATTDENVEATDGQEQLTLMNMEKLREKVLANAGNDNGTLLALMHAYEDALRIMNHLEPIEDQDDGTETNDQTNTDAGTGLDTGSDAIPNT